MGWDYINEHNIDSHAFRWTAKSDEILDKVECARKVLDMS